MLRVSITPPFKRWNLIKGYITSTTDRPLRRKGLNSRPFSIAFCIFPYCLSSCPQSLGWSLVCFDCCSGSCRVAGVLRGPQDAGKVQRRGLDEINGKREPHHKDDSHLKEMNNMIVWSSNCKLSQVGNSKDQYFPSAQTLNSELLKLQILYFIL